MTLFKLKCTLLNEPYWQTFPLRRLESMKNRDGGIGGIIVLDPRERLVSAGTGDYNLYKQIEANHGWGNMNLVKQIVHYIQLTLYCTLYPA